MSAAAPQPLSSPASSTPKGILVDTVPIPGGGDLQLLRYGDHFEIMFDDTQLMNSWAVRSEEALATLVLGRTKASAPRVLIGGLGMGFTLAAARRLLPPDGSIVVAELVPGVVEWARGPLAPIVGASLDDERVCVDVIDVHDRIARERGAFDVILLDVDNGPDGLIQPGNERLYCDWGLRTLRAALRPGGLLGIWSAYPDDTFPGRLRQAGFAVEEVGIGAATDGEAPHIIWICGTPD